MVIGAYDDLKKSIINSIEMSGDYSSENTMIRSTIKIISNEKPALTEVRIYC